MCVVGCIIQNGIWSKNKMIYTLLLNQYAFCFWNDAMHTIHSVKDRVKAASMCVKVNQWINHVRWGLDPGQGRGGVRGSRSLSLEHTGSEPNTTIQSVLYGMPEYAHTYSHLGVILAIHAPAGFREIRGNLRTRRNCPDTGMIMWNSTDGNPSWGLTTRT